MSDATSIVLGDIDERQSELIHRNYALAYGGLAGLVFSLVGWGYDALLLWRGHAALPLLTWFIGTLACLMIGLLAGWLSHKFHHILVSFIIWILVGIAFSRLIAHLPFEGYTIAIKLLYPRYDQIINLPYPPDAAFRMVLVTAAILIACVIAGLLCNFFIDTSQESVAPIGAILPMIIWIALFALAAVPAEMEINALFRNPVVNTDQAIEYVLTHPNQAIDPKTTSETGYRSILAIKDLLSPRRSLLLTNFQDDMLGSNVAIDFGGKWAYCSVLNGRPSFCKVVESPELIRSH